MLLFMLVTLFSWTSAQQLHCPGRATIHCSVVTPAAWSGTAFNEQCTQNGIRIEEGYTMDNISDTSFCGELNLTIIDVITTMDLGSTVVTVNSSLSFSAQPSLSGSTVVCRRIGDTAVAGIELLIPDPTQVVFVSQRKYSGAVTVTLMGGDIRCISLYFVEVTQIDSSDLLFARSSPSPSINVTELDLCQNRYSVVGYVQDIFGVEEGRSSPQEIADLCRY